MTAPLQADIPAIKRAKKRTPKGCTFFEQSRRTIEHAWKAPFSLQGDRVLANCLCRLRHADLVSKGFDRR